MEATGDFYELEAKLYKEYKEKYLDVVKKPLVYGTAGFRARAEFLDIVALRIGVFAGLYAKYHKDEAIGVVITASHNPIEDNGIKIISHTGHMMSTSLEGPLATFVNDPSLENAFTEMQKLLSGQFKTEPLKPEVPGLVFVGYDTRPSSPRLFDLLLKGLKFTNATTVNLGQITTPLMHDVVPRYNRSKKGEKPDGKALIDAYYNTFATSLAEFFESLEKLRGKPREKQQVILDVSNGVGITSIKYLEKELSKYFAIRPINDGTQAEFLNNACGAEFIQKERKIPRSLTETIKAEFSTVPLNKISFPTFDGDADRLVYYIPDFEKNNVSVVEGDKIGAMYAKLVQTLLQHIAKNITQLQAGGDLLINADLKQLRLGTVVTAYANGAFREFATKELGVFLVISPTGVKHSHKIAEQFDFGIYFESNGHGTCLVHADKLKMLEELTQAIGDLRSSVKDAEKIKLLEDTYHHLRLLVNFLHLSNQGTGDAFGNFLMVECYAAFFDQTIPEASLIYIDLPSSTTKIHVGNKDAIKNSTDEQFVTEPEVIQKTIDSVVSGIDKARAFVRPSGTEDVVRLYVEAKDEEKVREITKTLTDYLKSCKEIN